MKEFEDNKYKDLFSRRIRSGKRTYFFDVRETRNNDCYIVITESKKRFEDGTFIKHKIFLYKEDFDNFSNVLKEAFEFIKNNSIKNNTSQHPKKNNNIESK